jgi:hypothetical protein
MPRSLKAWLVLAVPLLCPAADDSRPACTSENKGRMWPEAANHDPKIISRLVRCGELFICVRGPWHYRWESPSVRIDQLEREAKSKISKPSVCDVQALTNEASRPDPSPTNGKLE